MAMEVEEVFPSFSTQRIRSKVQLRSEGPVTQRRLDYNAPLLSVRRRADAEHGDAMSKVWKLSAELSKEPLRVPGAVPFTWEHIPGQPKQPESPPRPPSSPSPPSTPSPPSVRRASPASPTRHRPPPSLRPLFLRSNSETLFAPPPPPPPPPPPLPPVHRLPLLKQRTVDQPSPSSGAPRPPAPPPPPPPPHTSTRLNVRTVQASTILAPRHCPDPERMGAFRLVDPTEGFLRVLRARREKAEPQEFLTAEAATDEVEEKRHKEVILGAEEESASERTSKHGLSNDGMAQVGLIDDKTNCVAVDVIVQRFLEEHPGAAAEEAASPERQDKRALKEDDRAGVDAVTMSPDPPSPQGNLDTLQQGKDIVSNAIDDPGISMAFPGCISGLPHSYSDEAAESEHKDGPQDGLATEFVPSHTWQNGGPVCVSDAASMAHTEVQLDAGDKQKTLMKEQKNRRHTSKIAILDTCRIDSLRMFKSAILHLCRKAATASLRTLNKAKRKIAASRRTSSSRQVVVHPNASRAFNEGCSDREEEAVASVVKTDVQGPLFPEVEERSFQEAEQPKGLVSILHSPPIISSRSSNGIVGESREINLGNATTTEENRVCIPVSSPDLSTQGSPSPHHENNEAEREKIVSSLPHEKDDVSSSSHQIMNEQGSPGLQPSEEEEVMRLESRSSSVRHVYAKSLGGDEPNEFYDASSRFGSRGSTPSRFHLNRSMSRDWSNLDEFSDATSTPFESPRTSVSDIRFTMLNAEHTEVSVSKAFSVESCTRPASKLSKRVGKSLWVETRDVKATGKGDARSMDELKARFASGELHITSNKSGPASDITENNYASRKCVSAEQASSSKVDARRQYRRRALSNGKSFSHAIAVTPVYPSKCQKNRSIASVSGLPRQISTGNMADVGWPLGISGYPPLKTCAKAKEVVRERGATKGENNVMVPLPPLPPAPAGGSWLRKALSSNTCNHAPSHLAGLHAKKVESSTSLANKWEDIVKGSHIQPGHLRFSEELHHHPPAVSTSKYYVS